MIRVGVMGAGKIATDHIKSVGQVKGAKVTAISNRTKATAEKLASENNIPKVYKSHSQLVNDPDLDAVFVCLPNNLHVKYVLGALKTGKHVLCEKPIANTVAGAKKIAAAGARSRRIVMPAYVLRFAGPAVAAKKYIKSGKLGDIYHMEAEFQRTRAIPGIGSWFTNKKVSGGGSLIDLGCHVLDLGTWLLGFPKVKTVSGQVGTYFGNRADYYQRTWWTRTKENNTYDVEDFSAAFIRFKQGKQIITLNFVNSWAGNVPKDGWRVWVFGTKGSVRLSHSDGVSVYREVNKEIKEQKVKVGKGNLFLNEVRYFLECVKKNQKPAVHLREAVYINEIIEAIYTSSKRQKEVH